MQLPLTKKNVASFFCMLFLIFIIFGYAFKMMPQYKAGKMFLEDSEDVKQIVGEPFVFENTLFSGGYILDEVTVANYKIRRRGKKYIINLYIKDVEVCEMSVFDDDYLLLQKSYYASNEICKK